jgi:predicted amidohydrolase YtcJ
VRLTFLPPVAEHHHPDLMRRTGQHYARLGITTAQDGATDVGGMKMLRKAADDASIPIDVVCYPLYQLADRLRPDADPFRRGYTNHVRVGGLEIVLDGIPPFADDDVYRMVADCFARSIQVLAHANGDAAEQMIEAVARAERRHGRDAGARRPVMVQPQTVSEEQLDRMLALGIVPSFFSTQCFYSGDREVASASGRERAYRLSPARSAARRGLRFSLHNDSPVVPPNSLFLVWNAVTRLSRGGEVIGPDQRLTPAEALRAVTLDAAYQCFEDGAKGSIEVGKLADMVVLSDNPLRVAPEAIREIAVLATLKEGVPIHILERARLPEALAAAQIG